MGANAVIEYSGNSIYKGRVKEKQQLQQATVFMVPHGQGIMTFKDCSKIQGQFIDGELIKGCFHSQDLEYNGSFKDQNFHGQVILIDQGNTIYEGEFQHGRLKKGIITKKNGKDQTLYRFQGQIFELQHMNAKGKLKIQLGDNKENLVSGCRILNGEFVNGNLQGQGRYQFKNGDFYQGIFSNGKLNRQTLFKSKDIQLTGRFYHNEVQSEVKIIFSNRDIYEGEIRNGKMHGRGKYTYADGNIYQGEFYHGQQWGQCKITYLPNSKIQAYEGQVSRGIYHGIGVLYYANGAIFKGFFQNGMKNGFGVYIYGKSKYKCLYMLNTLAGELKQVVDN